MKFFVFLTILLTIIATTTSAANINTDININQQILQLNQLTTIPVTLTNTAKAATFEIQLTTNPQLTAFTNTNYVELQTNEIKHINIYATSTTPGPKTLTISLLSNNTVIKQKTITLQTANKHDLQIRIPQEQTITNCKEFTLNGYAQNKGTATEQITIKLKEQTQTLTVAPLETTPFAFTLKNVKELELKTQIMQNGKTTLYSTTLTNNCIPQNQKYTVTITNNQKTTMKGLRATITGLPNQWQILTRSPTDLQPGETTTFDVIIKPTTQNEDDIQPRLQITDSKGSEIYKQQLPTIKSTSPLTAQFTKQLTNLSQNTQTIIAIIAACLLLIALFAKKQPQTKQPHIAHDVHDGHNKEHTDEHQTHLQNEHDHHNEHH